jgi:Zn-dependent protease with chaperone function
MGKKLIKGVIMKSLVCKKEKGYFVISLIVSILVYLILAISIVGLLYILIGAIIAWFANGLLIGNIKGNGIKISEKQFPEAYQIVQKFSGQMKLKRIPEIYVIQSGGLLNAFATKFLGRNFVVIYSDILEVAYEKGENAISFIIAHELAHIERKHHTWKWFLYPSMLIPFLGQAYSRACEYTSDGIAAYYQKEDAVSGLLILAAGKKLYQSVNIQELIDRAEDGYGFWTWINEIISTHPLLAKRIKNVQLQAEKNNTNSNLSSVATPETLGF